MKKKNLEKAIILGLILSTGVYGTAWAEDYNADKTYDQGITVTEGATDEHTVTGDVKFELGDEVWLTNNGGTVTVDGETTNGSLTVTTSGNKIIDSNGGTNTITMQGGITLKNESLKGENIYGLYNDIGNIELNSSENIRITTELKHTGTYDTYAIYNANVIGSNLIEKDSTIKINADKGVYIEALGLNDNNFVVNAISSKLTAEKLKSDNDILTEITAGFVNIKAQAETTLSAGKGIVVENMSGDGDPFKPLPDYLSGSNTVKIVGNSEIIGDDYNNYFEITGNGIEILNNSKADATVEIESINNSNVIKVIGRGEGIYTFGGTVDLKAENGENEITTTDGEYSSSAVINTTNSKVNLLAKENVLKGYGYVVWIHDNSGDIGNNIEKVTYIRATDGNNEISSDKNRAFWIDGKSLTNDTAKLKVDAQKGNNIIKGHAIEKTVSSNKETIKIEDGTLTVTATADGNNEINTGINEVWSGGINTDSNSLTTGGYDALNISGKKNKNTVSKATFTADTANKFYGSVYAQDKAVVDITAKDNKIASHSNDRQYTYAVVADSNNLTDDERTQINITANGGANTIFSTGSIKDERTVFATEGGVVNIEGTSIITADGWVKANESGYQANSTSQALIAGTHDWGNTTPNFDVADEERSEINLIYGNGSAITGDIAAGYAGVINIIDQSSGSGAVGISTMAEGQDTSAAGNSLTIMGNALAANGGKINLELGKGGVWQGRADDYQDAADENWAQAHLGEFNAVFSNDVQAEGAVNVALNDGATWDVMGQSWLTKLGGNDGVIDMRNTEGDDSRTSHAVHIGDLEGNHTFVMDLDTEHSVSDMLFIKGQASGEQKLWINSINGLENLDDGDSLRFATVNSAGLTFSGNYNFGSYENAKNGIMLADNGVKDNAFIIKSEEYDVNDSKNENVGYNGGSGFDKVKPGDEYVDGNYANGINWYLEREKAEDKTSDAGKTIINMSKVNYNNAIYMDRLNKRLGEARYISPEDEQGMWVRIRHDRIGKDDAFRSQNTMYEMGYDVKQDCDNGERRVGMAIDYMDGKAEYTGIAGDGDVKRYGLWLYDTWLGDKGHYTDYVLKWGHLENDFDIMARTTGEKITGDYSNNVFSASAEYGKKNDMGGGCYFEPQAQLQFARVTGADYVTSQDTKVSLDGINSLIGRAGFRLGRDLNENSTVYVKADLLHEFLGDQDITATDITGTLREEYENKGTWYDVGFGFATALGKSSYAFMDFEKSFGNDNDETYQINAGVQWTF